MFAKVLVFAAVCIAVASCETYSVTSCYVTQDNGDVTAMSCAEYDHDHGLDEDHDHDYDKCGKLTFDVALPSGTTNMVHYGCTGCTTADIQAACQNVADATEYTVSNCSNECCSTDNCNYPQ